MKLLFLYCCIPVLLLAQKKHSIDLTKIQSGPYIGLQQGRNLVVEVGFEKRFKEIKWKSPNAHAFNIGVNYDYKARMLGADAGYWYRPNRLGLTFGGQLAVRSNFDRGMVGFSPTLGYKIWLLHANIGYYIYPNPLPGIKTNYLFLQARLVFTEHSRIKNKNRAFIPF